tara:strand:+ start:1035 stop:1628 length:594 start_codon:yes stop_codon:yes gene_type:complete
MAPSKNYIPSYYNDLKKIEIYIWDKLFKAVKNKKAAFRYPALATYSKSNVLVRTVVLRKVNINKKTLFFFTDHRTKKINDLKNNSKVTIHIYDKKNNLQVQCYGKAKVFLKNKETKKIWDNMNEYSKKQYISKLKPGRKINLDQKFSIQRENTKKNYFSIIEVKVKKLEYLYLSIKNNERAVFEYKKNICISNWLQP